MTYSRLITRPSQAVSRLLGAGQVGIGRLRCCLRCLVMMIALAMGLYLFLLVPRAIQSASLKNAAESWHKATQAALPSAATLHDVQEWADKNHERWVYTHAFSRPQLSVCIGRDLPSYRIMFTRRKTADLDFMFDQYPVFGRPEDPDAGLISVNLRIEETRWFQQSTVYWIVTLLPVVPLLPIPIAVGLALKGLRETTCIRRGICPRCKYDLRGDHPKGCPECGWGREAEAATCPSGG